MAREDDFTDTVDAAAAHAALFADEYDPRDDQPTAAEAALDDQPTDAELETSRFWPGNPDLWGAA